MNQWDWCDWEPVPRALDLAENIPMVQTKPMPSELVVMELNAGERTDKKPCIQKIAEYLTREEYDLFLLTEMWNYGDLMLITFNEYA